MPNRRAQIVAYVDQAGDVESAQSWLAQWSGRLAFVSADKGCGCCMHIWEVEGPAEVLATIPGAIYAGPMAAWRRSPSSRRFVSIGVALTFLGVFVALANHQFVVSHGVAYWVGSGSGLYYSFPLCGLVWPWPPVPQDGATLALFICMLAHWPFVGWALDCWVRWRLRIAS